MAENTLIIPNIQMNFLNRTNKDKRWAKASLSVVLVLAANSSFAAPSAKEIFEQNCSACHQLENKKLPIVGPSLVEINHLYKNDVKRFVKWSIAPGKKRKDAIEMPSMAHVGSENLEKIHAWILEATKGKKFSPKKVKGVDAYALNVTESSKPRLQRIFMDGSSPASIAVTIDGQHSLCWDTLSCRMRYVWKGGFIDGFPYWKGNGNAFAKSIGEIYYRAPEKLNSSLANAQNKELPKFKGYKMVGGLPVFHYSLGAHNVSEAILNKDGNLVIQVKIQSDETLQGEVKYPLGDLAKTEFKYSAGKVKDGALVLTAKEAVEFELSFNLKK